MTITSTHKLFLLLPILLLFSCNPEDSYPNNDEYLSTSDYLEEMLIHETLRDEKMLLEAWADSLGLRSPQKLESKLR